MTSTHVTHTHVTPSHVTPSHFTPTHVTVCVSEGWLYSDGLLIVADSLCEFPLLLQDAGKVTVSCCKLWVHVQRVSLEESGCYTDYNGVYRL